MAKDQNQRQDCTNIIGFPRGPSKASAACMARPSSYNPEIHPVVAEAKKRDGWADAQIAEYFGICIATLWAWKKRYQEFSLAFEKGRDFVDMQVENAMLKRALGYEYEEVETEIIDTDGCKRTKVRKVKKMQAPDVGAQIFWLKNRRADRWRERPEEAPRAGVPGLLADFIAVIQSADVPAEE